MANTNMDWLSKIHHKKSLVPKRFSSTNSLITKPIKTGIEMTKGETSCNDLHLLRIIVRSFFFWA